ncbi:MAG: hypothetical protein AUK35_10565 [Zetaproteobacteria bacterium CG2_30_46_52]|nr:MAG: hypothetical protein AUK35_10565 [Zetaproteobacteria bacterium CG2_30_46_52]
MKFIGVCTALVFSLVYLPTAQASSFEAMNTAITNFEESGLSRFTPLGMKKITAYQGATMLIRDKNKSAFSEKGQDNHELKQAITKTYEVLQEAQTNAKVYVQEHSDLLALEIEANKAYVYHHKPQRIAEEPVQILFDEANKWLQSSIEASEKGQMNIVAQASKTAELTYIRCINAAMPGLVEETERALSRASSAGAEKYAPQLWRQADEAFKQLEAYNESLKENALPVSRPRHIGFAFEMAIYAQKMAIQVKEWRYDNGSHEDLALTAIQLRLDMAKALDLKLAYEQVGIDVPATDLMAAIENLKQAIIDERTAHHKQVAQLQAEYEQNLSTTLQQQRLQDQQDFQSKLTNIKTAFNSKLEQETFESKRQKKLRELFEEDEVDIIAHLNGELVIRAKKVQFAPNTTKIESKYFDLLSRVKEGIKMYPERNIKIEGHTDSIGDETVNRTLSLNRAESVQEYLIASGVEAKRIKALGFGEVKPIASNIYEQGRTMNRRIDIVIEKP